MTTTREAILAAAKKAFSVNGYHGTGLDEIAQQLNIRRQALYHYFPRKVDVLIELHKQMIDLFHQNADEALADMDRRAGEAAFTTLVRTHIRTVAENIALVTVFLKESSHLPHPESATLNALRRAYQERFVAAYRSGVRHGTLRDIDPRVAVNIVLGAANQLIQWYSPAGDFPPDKIPEVAVDLLSSGFVERDGQPGVAGAER